MIVLDDPANPFSLIFSIRKIPNDLLDLERLNRPGESVPSRESPSLNPWMGCVRRLPGGAAGGKMPVFKGA